MRRVVLVFNPAAGQRQKLRARQVEAIVAQLRAAGIEVECWPTFAPGSAIQLAGEAVAKGFDAVLACGGDGTVHEVAQGLAGSEVALGVIPVGTANLIAVNLGLSNSPLKAVARLLKARVERVRLARIEFLDPAQAGRSRSFVAVAGVGPDSLFLSRPEGRLKRQLGYVTYVFAAFRVWWTHSYPLFETRIFEPGKAEPRIERYSQLLSIRIRQFGPILRDLVPAATLDRPLLRLVGFKSRRRRDFLGFFATAILLQRARFGRRVESFDALVVECRPEPGATAPILVEADGEVLGQLPARLQMTGQTIALLVPPRADRFGPFQG